MSRRMKKPSMLILHHFEPCWDYGLRMNADISFQEMQRRAVKHIRYADYEKVIVTRFEHFSVSEKEGYSHDFLVHVSNVYEYGYAWEKGMEYNPPCYLIDGAGHSNMVLIDYWMEQLANYRISIGGFFDGECLLDLETALRHLKVGFRRIEHLIV